MTTKSFWLDTANPPKFPALQEDLKVDALVIGGGNTGVVTAYLMKKAGLKVALIERGRCGSVDTGHTSAHLTYVTDLRIKKLIDKLGNNHARAVLDAGDAAIRQIEENVRANHIDCDFAHVPGYLHASLTEESAERDELKAEAELANELGYPAAYVDSVPLFDRPGVRFPNQARFHPIKYLHGLLETIPGDGSYVFEQTEAEEFSEDSLDVKAGGHTISSGFIVIATHVPLQGKTSTPGAALFQTKIFPYTSYVISAKLPRNAAPDALFWDTSDPYFFFRLERRGTQDYAVFGGLDHKTGQETDTKERFDKLEEILLKFLPQAEVEHRWSGQVVQAVDGLPYIGETASRQFIATGYTGNGLTFGTIAGMMACDAALGRKNPWQDVFDVNRKKLRSLWDYMRENSDYPYYMIRDRLAKSEGDSLTNIKPGQGKILTLKGQRAAVYRDAQGKVTQLSPLCTHMGCIVHWNETETTWDCPCHGSRFKPTGEVLAGPAETPLKDLPE